MKVDLIMNGTLKLVIMPENDLEKMALEQFAKAECESSLIDRQTQILDKVVTDGLIIRNVNKKNV